MKIKHFILILLLNACQTNSYFATKETFEPSGPLIELLTKDILITMEKNFPPAKGRLMFVHDKERLALSLEEALRKNGYALINKDQKIQPGDIRFAYTLDSVGSLTIILRMVVGDNFHLSRLYTKKEDGSFAAAGPLLIRKGG